MLNESDMSAQDYFNRGVANGRNGNLEQAIKDFNKAIKINSEFAEAYYYRGIAHSDKKNFDKAIEDLNKAITLNPDYAEAYYYRGITYRHQTKLDKAIEDFNKAIELNTNYAEVYYYRGFAYIELEKPEKAIKDFSKVINLKPDEAKSYYYRGFAYAELENFDEAIVDYKKAIEINPELDPSHLAGAHSNRGVTYMPGIDPKMRIEDHDLATEIDLELDEPYNNRGLAYLRSVKLEKVFEDPVNPELDEAYRIALDKAIKDFNSAIKIKPEFVLAYYNRGIAYLYKREFEKAIKDFSKAINLKPDEAKSYYYRARAYMHTDKFKKAIKDYNKTIALNPKFAAAYFDRAIANYILGLNQLKSSNLLDDKEYFKKAVADYDLAIEHSRTIYHSIVYYSRSFISLWCKRWNEARFDLTRAQKKGLDIRSRFLRMHGGNRAAAVRTCTREGYEFPDDIIEMLTGPKN